MPYTFIDMQKQQTVKKCLYRFIEHLNDLVYLNADTNYTIIHLENGRSILISYTLKRFEKLLKDSEQFVRIHRSYLVNTRHIKYRTTSEIILKDGLVLPVARRRRGKI